MSRSRLRAVAAAALLAALCAGAISVQRVRRQLSALEVCEAARVGDWSTALAGSETLLGRDPAGRSAGECRCHALLATGAPDRCSELLEGLLSDGDVWLPSEALSIHLIQARRDRGLLQEAAHLAVRASARYPESGDLFYLELVTRSSVEDEARVLRELDARVADDAPQAARMRASLANRHLLRGDPRAALQALGPRVPAGDAEHQSRWFDARALAFGSAGKLDGVRRTFGAWQAAGGDPRELRARYALTLSLTGLADPRRDTLALLREALAESAELDDPKLRETVAIRLILTLVASGLQEEALATYDRARARFELTGLTREELSRSAAQRGRNDVELARQRGTLRFEIADPAPSLTLWVSPDPREPSDTDFEAFPVPEDGGLTLERGLGTHPQRWVLRDAGARVLASGTVAPVVHRQVRVPVNPGPPREPARFALSRRPGDGRQRVFVILLDCGDWRLVQYLRARGDLPVLDGLLERGYRAVLTSDPPLTAAAMEALAWPGGPQAPTLLGLVHRLGVELAGLAPIGTNPFAALSWLLPERESLFSTIGEGPYVTANLLFSHGHIDAGRHSEIVGPGGRSRRVPLARSARDLLPAERTRWPGLAGPRDARDAHQLRIIAAEFDSAEEIASASEVDLLLLRIEPLDLITHANFAEAVTNGQDDGQRFLFAVYRYIDARLGALHNRLDADDVLITMSDHGIRTAMEHAPEALFIASGPGIPTGRAPGAPDLGGVPRALADLLEVETDWRDTGVAPWAKTRALARARP